MRTRQLALLLGSLLAGFLLSEVVLRVVVGSPIVWRFPQELYVLDQRLGHRLRPNQLAFTHDKAVETNHLGLRDREYSEERDPGLRRILTLGDSQTFGLGLSADETWPKQLQAELGRANARLEWEVVNAGVPATDSWQHELMLADLVDRLSPHFVILGFYVNDVSPKTGRSPFRIGVELHWSRRLLYLLKRSAVATAVWQARDPLCTALGRPSTSHVVEERILSGASDAMAEQGWAQVAASFSAMRDFARGHRIGFAILVIPRRDQVSGQVSARAYNRRIAQIAAQLDVRVVDVLEPLQVAYQEYGRDLFIPWDGHNSAIANEILAQSLAHQLLPELEEAH